MERLTNLLNDLDEISRLERGELQFIKQNFIIQELVKETFESISIMAEQKNIRCHIKKGCESPLMVFADKEKIRQVLLNLVENSIKYGKQNGSITASMYNTDGKHILVEISDDGSVFRKNICPVFLNGFTEQIRDEAWIYRQWTGLAICKHIMEAHGQTIHVRSREDVGTTIGFTLDRKKD